MTSPDAPSEAEVAAALMRLARSRGPAKTFCPSEAARALAHDWRPLMPRLRRVAAGLPLRATQGGRAVDPCGARGPIRLSLDPEAESRPEDDPAPWRAPGQSRWGERG
jgi:hypothetical protein